MSNLPLDQRIEEFEINVKLVEAAEDLSLLLSSIESEIAENCGAYKAVLERRYEFVLSWISDDDEKDENSPKLQKLLDDRREFLRSFSDPVDDAPPAYETFAPPAEEQSITALVIQKLQEIETIEKQIADLEAQILMADDAEIVQTIAFDIDEKRYAIAYLRAEINSCN